MFPIKIIKISNNTVYIIDKNNKTYTVSINNSNVSSLLGLASKKGKSITKNIKYIEFIKTVSIVLMIICAGGGLIPLLSGKFYAELFLIGFGILEVGTISLFAGCKLFIKWLEKYRINNEYWTEIYDGLVDGTLNNSYSKQNIKTYENKEIKYNSYQNTKVNRTTNYNTNTNTSSSTYGYKKSQIIQDNVSYSSYSNMTKDTQISNTYGYTKNQIIQDDLSKDKVKIFKRY